MQWLGQVSQLTLTLSSLPCHSLCLLDSPIMCWEGWTVWDDNDPSLALYYYNVCGILGTVASSLYLVDALLVMAVAAWSGVLFELMTCRQYFADWLVLNRIGEESIYGQHQLRDTSVLQRIDWYFLSCVFFLLGIIADFVTSHYGGLSADEYVAAYEYAWYSGSMIFWTIYAVAEIIRTALDERNRDALNAPVRFYLFPCGKREKLGPSVQYVGFAWDMAGSILFLVASLIYLISANWWFFWNIADCPDCYIFEIVAASLFVLNGLCAMVRKAFAGGYVILSHCGNASL